MNHRSAGIVVLALAVLVCGTASATVVVPIDLGELVRSADTIAYGRVVSVYGVRVDGRYTDTLVTLTPSEVIKGRAGADIVFRVAGGTTGRYQTVVVGAPVLHEGDEIVVFLAGQAPQVPHLVGFSQGMLPILRDAAQRAIVIAPPLAEGATASPVVRGDGQKRVMTLSTFADQVRSLSDDRGKLERDRARIVRAAVVGGQAPR
jgi:hypothetical protein